MENIIYNQDIGLALHCVNFWTKLHMCIHPRFEALFLLSFSKWMHCTKPRL